MKDSPKGKIYAIGTGPGDPELITLKALKYIKKAKIIAYHQSKTEKSHALNTIKKWLNPEQILLPLTYPFTTELSSHSIEYQEKIELFYKTVTKDLRAKLDNGLDICILAEGDPTLYSSFFYIFDRLHEKYTIEIVPGISSFFAASSALQLPLCYKNQSFLVLPATLSEEELIKALDTTNHGGIAFLKIGRNLNKICRILKDRELFFRAFYIEYASQDKQKMIALKDITFSKAPYFSIILVSALSPYSE